MMLALTSEQLWFASRGAGTMTLVLLTTTVVMGVVTAGGWRSESWPRFVSVDLHRNIALLTITLMCLHIVTVVADPFVTLRWWDAVIPFQAHYRPFWVGMGVVTAELVVALTITSSIRGALTVRAWRILHWAGYSTWIFAMLHSLGSGTDARATWSNWINVICGVAVVAAIIARALSGWQPVLERESIIRGMAIVVTLLAVGQLTIWASQGPLKPGWNKRAGTPSPIAPPVVAPSAGVGGAP